ncbi:hypothetical protein N752_11260 [Desulforamulus aquiferis]|nr:hypothetical protein N752_11260 [Desulforamulus aquiferis]
MYKFKRGFNPEVVEFIGEYDMVLNKGMYLFWNLAEPLYLKALVNLGKLQLLLKKNLSRRQNCDPAVE